MGDDDWDIGAVVRSCNINRPNNVVAPHLGFETSENNVWNSLDTLLVDGMPNFNDLSEIFCKDFPTAHQKKSDDQVIIVSQSDNQQLYLNPIQPAQFIQQSSFPPSQTTQMCVSPTTTTPQEMIDLQQLDIGANVYPNSTFSLRAPLIQTSIGKNKSTRITYELLQEELTNDIWTWRKYGQKHIKGSPFPRNYYKCSTSKLCKAKKGIEKSPKDENLYLVSYSGEHNHDQPVNDRYRSGCNNSSKLRLPKGINIVPKSLILNATSSLSQHANRSRAAASPCSPTKPMLEIEGKKMISASFENKGDGKEKENVNEDILMGFEEHQGVTASTQ